MTTTPEREALAAIMRAADAAKEPCGADPESPAAIRNAKFASIASIAAQGLGLIRGPSLAASPAAGVPQPLTDEQIDAIANDGCRNAAGGIYATSVYEFARAVEAEALATQEGASHGL